jgi:transcriptional regulator with XRE-family HTH domain
MPQEGNHNGSRLTGHALRNAHLRERALNRALTAPALARAVVAIRARTLGMTRLEFVRRSGMSRGTLRDLELGVHTPTRHTLQEFVEGCRRLGVGPVELEELRGLYAGPGDTLEQFIARLELHAGSTRELARRVGISTATLWEYRRGNFPLPLALLRKMCKSVGVDAGSGEVLWHDAERRRFVERGYPEAWAELCVWCMRRGQTESHVLNLGVTTTAFRRLRYLELPSWPEVAKAAHALCASSDDLLALQKQWMQGEREQRLRPRDRFGPALKALREARGITRRELADLFGIGGKKPARIIKHIEEDGLYSAQAYPAGLAAVVTEDAAEQERLLQAWRQRRRQFHRRHRPEMRLDLRLERELYGFGARDMEAVLGYTSLEYQRLERGVGELSDSARARILQALQRAGQRRVTALRELRRAREAERAAWRAPATAAGLVASLIRREGGLIPLARRLRAAGVMGLWPGRLRMLADGIDMPAWPVVERIGRACGVTDLEAARRDWAERYRMQLQSRCPSPLGVELRLLIAEVATTLRDFSPRLGVNYSVLVREFQRIDRDEAIRWFHVERILRAVGLPPDQECWREIRALWATAGSRRHGNTSERNSHPNGEGTNRRKPMANGRSIK